MADYTKINLKNIEDAAAKHGYGDHHKAHFASKPLGLEKSGLSYQFYLPGKRSMFGHKHREQEEIFIVLEGDGRIKLDDEIIEVSAFDAVRVAPGVTSALEAGPKGMGVLITGAPKLEERDWEMQQDWWTE